MTGEEFLDLSKDEQDAMSDLGYQIARMQNVNSIDALAQKFLDAGMMDDALRVLGLKDDAIAYMATEINTVTGWNVNYNDTTQQWYNTDTGRFMGKIQFDRTLTDDEYEQAILDKFGENPLG
jgi:hypothetical protein